ncbi:hypothetical protein FOVG_01375 [Fusarium oxysporum f. sp. pisi HDV247]|uniref:Uncharacterized protein n=2 Tax=Fusarium oxysporum f. sp. pisi HDV247 TaxID=1080344 RepID=W9Q809_FUSOX|nr:hypothetical protein FOVG_01375 [Fusarium oxysporum f. sp. pisi HDV247]
MPELNLIRAKWDFLKALHPLFLFAESLPTVEGADQGRYGSVSVDDVDSLKNQITMLRNDFKLNIIKQQLIDIDQLAEEGSRLGELHLELQSLLGELEDLVDPKVGDINEHELKPAALALTGTNIALGAESNWGKTYSQTSVAQAASYIRFPQEVDKIGSCRRTVSRFGMVLDRLEDSVGLWTMEAQALDYTSQDVAAIQYAHTFASTCTSLFDQIVSSARCGTPHKATLHLSGFKGDQLRMNIGTCQETGWIPTLFTRSSEKPPSDLFSFSHMCSHSLGTQIVHVAFNSLSMWEDPSNNSAGSEPTPYFGIDQSTALDGLLVHEDPLKPKYRKLAGVLLASSLFQLGDSPWTEQLLGPHTIFVPSPDKKRLDQWCPQVLCTLASKEDNKLQSDDIAAFGVLVLELEAGQKAHWTNADSDWISGEKSNHVRLARILKDWEDVVGDDYRGVGKACLEFDSLIENLDHPDILSDQKGIAVIYKCILEPLFRHLMKNFGNLAPLFDGMFGPWTSLTAAMSLSPSNTAKRALFDDDESLSKPGDQITALNFLKDLKPFFEKVSMLRKDKPIGLMEPLKHERIRIAVLDSGVDDTDPKIRFALKFGRINADKIKSFIGQPNEWQDTYGHGTHVTRLLLETAPAAEIYIGKICIGKMINDEFMPGIAKAIDWAVKDCDAHIISISFGFEDANELIDEAIDRAVEAGKLIFAAASNNGGISGRARPARSEDVFCVHASDGKGNKGGMNPTPMDNRDNFATLGVAVPSKWKGNEVWKSGTSFATPIAAGFAADVLEFANHKCANLTPMKKKLLHKKRGMQAIFRKMAEKRDDYHFVHPNRLWPDEMEDKETAKVIEDIMRDI